jgi:large subunit ribosomal protein L18
MKKASSRKTARQVRHRRVRKKVSGTAACPRMVVTVSNRNMYVQFVDDAAQTTLAAAMGRGRRNGNNVAAAKALGARAAEAALAAGIKRAVVDRGGHRFHGRVKAVADAAIESGLMIGSREET